VLLSPPDKRMTNISQYAVP